MIILGFSCFYHDSSACIIKDGIICSAVQEERFTRIKHDANFPINSIKYCLANLKIKISDVDYVVFYDKPFLKFERLLETYFAMAPKGFNTFSKSFTVWVKEKLFQKKILINNLNLLTKKNIDWTKKLLFSEHHLSHASSAFFPSPFESAAILTMDGVGEWATTSLSIGEKNKITIKKEIHYPHSLGLLYSSFTFFTGFKVNSGEYKLMGLAPYGRPKYKKIIKDNLINVFDDGSFQLNMDFFDFCTGLKMTNSKFSDLFKREPRSPESPILQDDMDIACSIQAVTEDIVINLAKNIKKETQQKNLCLAGGVALNCVANGKLLSKNIFEKIWIQPAAGDAGGAIGAAYVAYYMLLKNSREINPSSDSMNGSYLGPEFSNHEISSALKRKGANYHLFSEDKIISLTAQALKKGQGIAWMNGKMEFGPRALGNRSIIADPRSKYMQKILNLKIKYRESFRPFAPSILEEDLSDWFDLSTPSPYMLFVAPIKKIHRKTSSVKNKLYGIEKLNQIRSKVPSITHVDYSARIQTVNKSINPRFHKLIKKFKSLTGVPMVINTSFNIRGEPIVCTPEDAFRCFMGTELDILVINNFILFKNEQNPSLSKNYKNQFNLD